MYKFRDPIHGFIEVSKLERRIIDSPPFQRLRSIKQLATTNLVYHGAEHTRFGHSIGVMHLVTRAFDEVIKKTPDLFSDKKKDWYRQILRLIGLTHDLGHAPFSHATEELFESGYDHEAYTKKILFDTEISTYIKEIGSEFVEKYDMEYNITPELIWMIYDGKDILNEKYIMPDFKFLKSFMDSELDCDKMDYLLRDSHYCGVNYGHYDLEKLISSFTVYKPNANVLLLAIEKDGIHALEEFVLARYFMFIQVYFHKTRRFLDYRLIKAMANILPDGKLPIDINGYLEWDDSKVVAKLKKTSTEISRDFLDRKIFSNVYQTDAHATSDGTKIFKMIVNALNSRFQDIGLSEEQINDIMIVDEISKDIHKIADSLEDEKAIPVIVKYQVEPKTIFSESLLIRNIREPIVIKRIYISKEYTDVAEKEIKKLM